VARRRWADPEQLARPQRPFRLRRPPRPDGGWPPASTSIYILPTVIGIARQVEGLGLIICLNVFPVGWLAALILARLIPRKQIQ
jgi:hypothetical protein